MLSDDELVEQILLGNENAAEELIKRYYTSILRYCRWHCSNLEKAEDLTQETFLKLFKNLSGYKGKKKFKAYLYTIANHLCVDESRKVEFSPLEDEENIVHEYNDIVRLEDRAEISYFLNFLSSEQREAVILRFSTCPFQTGPQHRSPADPQREPQETTPPGRRVHCGEESHGPWAPVCVSMSLSSLCKPSGSKTTTRPGTSGCPRS